MKAIPTRYAGCHFRSRLEARWAVFFDTLGIAWNYESEGYEIDNPAGGTWQYLPDFYLPELRRWVEVKGDHKQLTADYLAMIAHGIDYDGPLKDGVLFLGDIPDTTGATYVLHNDVRHHKGLIRSEVAFTTHTLAHPLQMFDDLAHGDAYADGMPPGVTCTPRVIRLSDDRYQYVMVRRVADAYRAARQARFEHGETPAVPGPRPPKATPGADLRPTAEARRRLAERGRLK